MTKKEKKTMQAEFFAKLGPNAMTFKAMMDTLPDAAFYIKDAEGRIMALNRRNCDICNIHGELAAIGKHSDDIFPEAFAQSYMARDRLVRETGKPIVNQVSWDAADMSNDQHIGSVFPLFDTEGNLVGTTCLYYKLPTKESGPDWHGVLKRVTDYVDEHYAENLTIEQLSALVPTSPSTFRRVFQKTFGISPGKYLINIRLNAARRLLETTDKLITEIAVETGFWDQSHFGKIFLKDRGITPSHYRRRYRLAKGKKEQSSRRRRKRAHPAEREER
ncbi:MAG: helix-turn-helix domain-containing protein [Kiritimatiellae bacterium]|nr:helix-turn-helix domain-containing protein [Kiritimatiellia bacterium]